jgi:predicted nucleic acid-binding protein
MQIVYLDTSALMKLFLPEPDGKKSMEKIEMLAKDKKLLIAMSDWTINEAIGVVRNKVLEKKKISADDGFSILVGILHNIEGCIELDILKLYPISKTAMPNSRILNMNLQLTTAGDALHIYFANEIRSHDWGIYAIFAVQQKCLYSGFLK